METDSRLNFVNSVNQKQDINETIKTNCQFESEETGLFAEGLPSWDIVPPQVVVRRRKNK